MITLLAVERDILVTEPLEALERERVVGALGLLQAKNVGPNRLDEFCHQVNAQPHRIDVPGREFEAHAEDGRQRADDGGRRTDDRIRDRLSNRQKYMGVKLPIHNLSSVIRRPSPSSLPYCADN